MPMNFLKKLKLSSYLCSLLIYDTERGRGREKEREGGGRERKIKRESVLKLIGPYHTLSPPPTHPHMHIKLSKYQCTYTCTHTHHDIIHTHMPTWSFKEPLVSSHFLCPVVFLKVKDSPEPQSSVGGDNLELGDHLLQDLSRVEGKWLLSETDLLVGVAKLNLKTKKKDNSTCKSSKTTLY